MTEPNAKTAPFWFWVAAIAAILWGLAGVYACYTQLTLSPAQLASMPTAQRDAFATMPLLIRIAYAAAVAGGLIGSVLLIARRSQALPAFVLSLVATIVQFGWVFGAYHGADRLGPQAMIFPGFIIGFCIGEIALTRLAIRRGWTT